jgi:hypothetical protein
MVEIDQIEFPWYSLNEEYSLASKLIEFRK